MANATSSAIRGAQRSARAQLNDPYQNTSASVPPHGPPWGLFNWIMTIAMGAILALISVVYVNLKEDIKTLKDDAREIRSVQTQTARDISDLRVTVARVGSQIDQFLQRPQK